MNEILTFIQGVGVPAAIAFFVLVKVNGKLDAVTKAIADLTIVIRQLEIWRAIETKDEK